MSLKNVPPYTAHFDGNQVPSLMGVEGTLGTTDSGGTARTIPIGANPQTNAVYVDNIGALSGVVLTTAVGVANGTATALPSGALAGRKAWIAYNSGTTPLYLGGTGVTGAGNGIPLGTGEFSPSIDLGTSTIYGIGTSTGGTVVTMEIS